MTLAGSGRRAFEFGVAALVVAACMTFGPGSAAEPATPSPPAAMYSWEGHKRPNGEVQADFEAFKQPSAGGAGAGIFQPDDRVQVADTLVAGPRAITLLLMYHRDGKPFASCSGTLLSKNLVLTAAHCLYSAGSYVDAVGVAPGAAPGVAGLGVAQSTKFAVPLQWRDGPGQLPLQGPSPASRHDWGLVVLDGDPFAGKASPYPAVANAPDSYFESGTVLSTMGYPGDKPPGTMWSAKTTVFNAEVHYLYTLLDIAPGQSGSPIFAESQGSRFIAGLVTVAGENFNVSPRFTPQTFDAMAELCAQLGCAVPTYTWVAGGPPLPPIPPGTFPVRGVAADLSRD